MNELQVQGMIRDAVRAEGGAGHKLSTPFKIGICDLLLKLPVDPAMLMEVKLAQFSDRIAPAHRFRLDVTHNQMAFLEQFATAGMVCGVVSAVRVGRRLLLCSLGLDAVRAASYTVEVSAHSYPALPSDIVTMLHRYCHDHGGGRNHSRSRAAGRHAR